MALALAAALAAQLRWGVVEALPVPAAGDRARWVVAGTALIWFTMLPDLPQIIFDAGQPLRVVPIASP